MSTPLELASLFESLAKQLSLLRQLVEELTTCRPAFVAMDLEGIYLHISKQTEICENLRKTEVARAAAWKAATENLGLPPVDGNLRGWLEGIDKEDADRFRRLLTELAVAEGEVRHQNRMHITLVDGSRRTLNVLGNALAAFSPTYALPRSLQSIIAEKAPA
jgi:hypothetical protein